VILIAPYFDIYQGPIDLCGAVLKSIFLKTRNGELATTANDLVLDMDELRSLITSKTKAILINTPHNPTGKVFSMEELNEIADVIKEHDQIVCISDEVYEFILYDDVPMARMCMVPGMWDRTLTVSSVAKTFSMTGWKIGWVYGPENLIMSLNKSHQFICFSIVTPLQEAIARGIEQIQKSYFQELIQLYTSNREILLETFREVGLHAIVPKGSFFVIVDISNVSINTDKAKEYHLTGLFLDNKDWNFCRWLTVEIGVAAIPCSCFYKENGPQNFVRFAFCKTKKELNEARTRLLKLKNYM